MNERRMALRKLEAHSPSRGWRAPVVAAFLATVITNAAAGVPPHASVGDVTTGMLSHAIDLGPMGSTSPIDLTVWLKIRDSAGLDRALAVQRTTGVGWLSEAQIDELHAPAAFDVGAVSTFLQARGLLVTSVGPHDIFVKARGTVAAVDAAFKVQLHQYMVRGTTFHASSARPTLPASIAPLVVSVGGLSDMPATPTIVTSHLSLGASSNVKHMSDVFGMPRNLAPLSSAGPGGSLFSAQCFYPPTTQSFSSSTVTASYSGANYGNSIQTTTSLGPQPPCAYQPSDLQTAYNLTPLYKAGFDGRGQTIAIIDPLGSATIQQDVAAFSAQMGLPPAKLQILGAVSSDTSFVDETTLDVEWAHAIAPGANILLVVAPSRSFDDLIGAILTATQQPGVVSISNSWAYAESLLDVPSRTAADNILKLAISKGISVNFATGDIGDAAIRAGQADVAYPASSPYATAVGGVSVALDSSKHILFQTAWGNNLMHIASTGASGSLPEDPPVPNGFVWGGGGGVSNVYPLPPFQAFLRDRGPRRLLPDISWVADPFTGVEVVQTANSQGDQGITVAGGTSASCPMFSALWAIAAQKAKRPLGQAAPLLYRLPPEAITDVLAPIPLANVTGTLTDASGTQQLTAEDLGLPLQGQATFLSALFNSSTDWWVLTFGTDSQLHAGPGWDPATGLGTPNGVAFVNALSVR
jgi:subtilase family serine protease